MANARSGRGSAPPAMPPGPSLPFLIALAFATLLVLPFPLLAALSRGQAPAGAAAAADEAAFVGATPQLRGSGREVATLARRAAPALAPAPVRVTAPSLPTGFDESRFGEKVRWLMDEDTQAPPAWNVLLLDKTYERPDNTINRVAAVLAAVLGLTASVALRKARHARDHFFAVAASTPDFGEAVGAAQRLQARGLVVRVAPGPRVPEAGGSDGNFEDSSDAKAASAGGMRRSGY